MRILLSRKIGQTIVEIELNWVSWLCGSSTPRGSVYQKLSTSVLTFETTPQIRFALPLTIELADDVLNCKTLFRLLPSRKEADVAEPAAGACAWCTETRGRGSPLQGYSNETLLRPIPESPKSILNFSIFFGSALQQVMLR